MEMTLKLPNHYVELEQEEMMYLDGGRTSIIRESASQMRTRLSRILNAGIAGAASSGLIALTGIAGKIIAVFSGPWFVNAINRTSGAHSEVMNIISRHGASRRVEKRTTMNIVYWITGMTVRAI